METKSNENQTNQNRNSIRPRANRRECRGGIGGGAMNLDSKCEKCGRYAPCIDGFCGVCYAPPTYNCKACGEELDMFQATSVGICTRCIQDTIARADKCFKSAHMSVVNFGDKLKKLSKQERNRRKRQRKAGR